MSINTVDGVARESAGNPHEDPAQGIHRAASALRKCARNGHPARSKAVVLLWASRYAWDVAEGRDGEEAITGLLGTAAVGSQSSPEPTPKAFYDGILTLAWPLARR